MDKKAEERTLKLMRLFKNLNLEIMAAHSGRTATTKKVLGFDPKRSGRPKLRPQVCTDGRLRQRNPQEVLLSLASESTLVGAGG